ncbi:MAG: hypothetical protein JWM90_3108 [Thermoleophilia bacterium]|nr:hypothetical protein [Thermoleophilia bacterium]
MQRGCRGQGQALIDSMTRARGAHAAPSASDGLGPLAAIGRLAAQPDAQLLGTGDRGAVAISRSPGADSWTLTTLAHPSGMAFDSPVAAVAYAVDSLGVEEFSARTLFLPAPTLPRHDPFPTAPIATAPTAPIATPASTQFPLTAQDAGAALQSGRATLIEGLGPDGRVYTLYGMSMRTSGGSGLSGTNRPSWQSGADEVTGRTTDGDVVVRDQTSYRVSVWAVKEGAGGRHHYVNSSRAGLDDLVQVHGVTAFRVPPQVTSGAR